MVKTKPTLLRLRETTVELLKLGVDNSPHRSMAALADEILERELSKRLDDNSDAVDKMLEAVRRGQQS